jgi:hypothetical protein
LALRSTAVSSQERPPSASGRAADRAPPRAGASGRREAGAGDRGQTTLDFAIGISIFLAVMLFVFAFVPGILEPFNLSGEEDIALSERIASDLSQGTLGNASTPYVLESHCTVRFFDQGTSSPGHCNYEGETVKERLGLGGTTNINVSLSGTLTGTDSNLICWRDGGNQDLYEAPCSGGDQLLAAGGTPPSANDATVTARRVVSLHQQNLTMKVVVW